MNQYTLDSRLKNVFIGGMVLGALCLLVLLIPGLGLDDSLHTRFWTNYLHNTVFFTGIAFISLFTLSAFMTAWAGWYVHMKRIWEAYSMFLLPGLIMMLLLIVGLWTHWHHLYHWADKAEVANDPILKGKASFLNPVWYTLGTIIIMGAWIYIARKLRTLSIQEDQEGKGIADNFAHHRKMRVYAAIFLPIAGFTSAALIWQWLMSIDAHWYSTLYAWYTAASWFVAAMALTIMTLIILKSRGYFEHINANHFHDLGKYLFAISIFWTYLWFSQYMLIWYGNVGEETVYFQERQRHYPILFWANLVMNFILPFLILMRNDTKRKYGTLFIASALVFLGHWIDFFQMIKPGARHTAMEALAHGGAEHGGEGAEHALEFMMGFTIPGLLEFGTMLGFLSFFLFFVLRQLEKAPLLPANDPYLEESSHHEVWPFPAESHAPEPSEVH